MNKVFDKTNPDHSEFLSVFNWLYTGKGKIVFGGTLYLQELQKAARYLKLFKEFRNQGRAIVVDNVEVDRNTTEVSEKIKNRDFDDQHLIGLLLASGCKLICSEDKRAHPFFTHSSFFKKKDKPKIYSGKRNANLLSDNNIAPICLPCIKATNKIKNRLPVI